MIVPLLRQPDNRWPVCTARSRNRSRGGSNYPDVTFFFVEPVAVALNHVAKQYAPEDVIMIGLSGGWTTTLYAATDPRVRLNSPVAGTLPDCLRVGRPGDRGDWEQFYPDLHKIANYLDLYVMGSTGRGRQQRQVLNEHATCCFWGSGTGPTRSMWRAR